jgi:acyl carrier protein
MAWGWWGDTDGMAAELTSADHTRMQRSGMLALAPGEGLALFDAAYALGAPSVVPARLDLGGMRAQARAGVVPPLLRGLVRVPEGRQQSNGGSLARRLANTPEPERARVVLEFVRGEVASVLGHEDPEAIDVHRAFNELGFDSLTAIELRNRLSGACGVQLPATLAFDYPSSAALSEFLLSQVSSEIPQPSEEDVHELELRSALASIPLARLREAGVLDTLLALAGLSRETPSSQDAESADEIDELDLESLVELTLGGDGETGESVKELT